MASLDSYSSSKVLRLFSLGLLSMVCPIILVRSTLALRRFFHAAAVIGGIFGAIVALRGPDQVSQVGRYTADAVGLSDMSRMIALPLLWVGVLVLNKQISFPRAALITTAGLWLMIRTGQRGPLLAFGIAVLVAVLSKAPTIRRSRRLMIFFAVAIAGWYALMSAPEDAAARLGTVGRSGNERLDSYRQTVNVIMSHPLGVGWGDWGDYVDLFSNAPREYPHNLLLEVASEAGVIALVALVVFLRKALGAAKRMGGLEGQAVLLLFLFTLVTSMFSGNINDNRMLLVASGMALVSLSRDGPRLRHFRVPP